MKKIAGCIAVLCGMMFFPTAAFAGAAEAEHENNIMVPVAVEAEITEAFTNEEQFQVGDIIITEAAPNMFSENQQYRFFIQYDGIDRIDYVFEEKERAEISEGTLKAEYEVKDGNLVVTITDSDPAKVESLSIPGLMVKKNMPYVILHMHSLYLSSDTDENIIPAVPELFNIEEYVPPTPQKPLDIEIRMDDKTLLVNQQKKDLKVPAYISDTGAIMLPVRELAEPFPGIILLWEHEKKVATILYDVDIIEIFAGTNEIKYVQDSHILSHGAEMKDGRMFINLRDFCKIFRIKDNEISWDAEEKAVTIHTTIDDHSKIQY